jgi:UDP-N-acetylmuramyl pentapeptide phosphotransferase/UDP-N-acetylglucosamine-1-phosphate transferase
VLISKRKKLYDIPDERKIHTRAIPRLGGVSFYPVILFSTCGVFAFCDLHGAGSMCTGYFISELFLFFCGMTVLYLTGIADDLVGVRYRQKFLVQGLCASFFPLSGLYINNLYGLFGIYEIPFLASLLLTVFTVVFIINAINLIDGIDGLASGLSGVSLLITGSLFLYRGLEAYSIIAFAASGVLVPFFCYNMSDSAKKIFMGDTGSLTLGYTLSFLMIKYSMDSPSVSAFTGNALLVAFSTLIIPLFDVVRVMLVRIRTGKNPFKPDKNHIHHKLLATGMTVKRVMLLLIVMSMAFSISNILLMPYVDNTTMLLADIVIWILLNLWWNRVKKNTHPVRV